MRSRNRYRGPVGEGPDRNSFEEHADAPDSVGADWQTVLGAVSQVQRQVDAELDRAGVPWLWFVVLQQLLGAPGHRLPMSKLAREVSMTSGGFTKLADRMAREGLIDRRGSSDDRRVVHASLSPDGVDLATKAVRVYDEALQRYVLDSISRADLASTARAMRELAAPPDDLVVPEFVAEASDDASRRKRREDDPD